MQTHAPLSDDLVNNYGQPALNKTGGFTVPEKTDFDVIVIGGGPAGMIAAIAAAKQGKKVFLAEKNEKLGKKLFITGKGRCNVTNAADVEDMLRCVVTNAKFLYSSFYTFPNTAVTDFFENAGVPLKTERGGRIFPVSDHSSDIIRALQKELDNTGVHIRLNCSIRELFVEDRRCRGVILSNGNIVFSSAVIIATGGVSYPNTGSDGDGYRFAIQAGHTVIEPVPSLVPLVMEESFCREMMGLSLKNVTFSVYDGKKCLFSEQGEMLFTHFGISGPLVLSASAEVGRKLHNKLIFSIDLKPALDRKKLDDRLIRVFKENEHRLFKNSLSSLFPAKMIPVMIRRSGIPAEQKCCEISKEKRREFLELIKNFTVTYSGRRGFKEAIITKGGVCVKEVDPAAMESRLTKNLYFAGEVLDLDAVTGGYNLQIAWSTGYLAGLSAAQEVVE